MKALPFSSAGELRALLVYDALPAGCIAKAVTRSDLAPHLRPGEFAIIDTGDRIPVAGELFFVAWIGSSGSEDPETGALCQAYRRHHTADGEAFSAWWVGSLARRQGLRAWQNGPYCDGALERQVRGRVIGLLVSDFEGPRRLTAGRVP